jgi:predicted nucleic acid-binding Zn ribbon protein
MSEASSTLPCPTCAAIAQRKISAGGGLVFKGSGFYITDYGKDGKKDQRAKATSSATKAASSKGESGASSAGEPKPAETKSSDVKSGESKPASGGDKKPAVAAPPPSKGSSEK